jgi:hypothetical protein
MDSIDNVRLTFDDMCEFGRAAQCRSYFVVLTLHGYETHAMLGNVINRGASGDWIIYSFIMHKE